MRSLDSRVDERCRHRRGGDVRPRGPAWAQRRAARCAGHRDRLGEHALRDLDPWDGEAAANRVRALALVRPLRDLVTAVVTDVRDSWWSAPLDRGAQLLLTSQDDPQRDPLHLQAPQGPNDAWETLRAEARRKHRRCYRAARRAR